MKVAIVLAILCCTPVFGQLDLGRAFAKFQRPYQCGQCQDAFADLGEQFCTGIAAQLSWIPFIDIKGLCTQGTMLVGNPGVQAFCTPFGICVGAAKGTSVINCAQCPAAVDAALGAICGFVPKLPIVDLNGACTFIAARLSDADKNFACQTAGFC